MHELSVTENILSICLKHASQANANQVTDVHISIGDMASIVDDSVQFYWDIITENTLCQGSKLHFNRIPANLTCLDCNHTYRINKELTPCPVCQGINVRLVSGEEFQLESIEITR